MIMIWSSAGSSDSSKLINLDKHKNGDHSVVYRDDEQIIEVEVVETHSQHIMSTNGAILFKIHAK